MSKVKTYLSLFGYGLLLWIIIIIYQIILSAITSSYDTMDTWWSNVITMALMIGCTWLFSRTLQPANRRQALMHGIFWAVMLYVICLLMAMANTWDSIFGQWSVYLIFVGAFMGPWFLKRAN